MKQQQFQFEWDEIKAHANVRKHGVSFEMAGNSQAHLPRVVRIS